MSPKGVPTIGRPRSLEERERDQIEAKLAADRAEVPMSEYHKQKAESERQAMLQAFRENRPPKPAAEAPAPESINPRVKAIEPEPEPALGVHAHVHEPVVTVPDASLVEAAAERHARAQETLAAAQQEAEEAEAALVQAQADHAAALAEQKLAKHRAILEPALARAQRQREHFRKLFAVYGGASGNNADRGKTHGPLARFAKTIPVGDPQRRERLGELFKQAAQLMEQIRLGWLAAREACEVCQKALDYGGTGDGADFHLEAAGAACAVAAGHDAQVVEQACKELIAAVKAVDGEPAHEEVVVYLDPSRDREAVKHQTHAEGVGEAF